MHCFYSASTWKNLRPYLLVFVTPSVSVTTLVSKRSTSADAAPAVIFIFSVTLLQSREKKKAAQVSGGSELFAVLYWVSRNP
jgi:hypothetical protein